MSYYIYIQTSTAKEYKMKTIQEIAVTVREVATDLVIDQLKFGDYKFAEVNAKLIKSCNVVEKLTEQDYAANATAIGAVYTIACEWGII